jgi:copper(I)-binding protein
LIEEAVVTATRTRRRGARLFAVSALVAGLAALSACSAGQITQTSDQVSAVPGASGNTGPGGTIALRNALVPYNDPAGYPQGGNAPIIVRIFNSGLNPVTFVSAEAPDSAASVELVGGTVATQVPTTAPPSPSIAASKSGSPSPSGSASASASASPSPSAAPKPAGPTRFAVSIAPSGYALLVPGQGAYLQLTGLTQALTPGLLVKVTFTFEDGSAATLTLPVGAATVALTRDPPAPGFSGGE